MILPCTTSTQGQHKLIWIMTAIWSANQPIRYLGMLPKGLASTYLVSKFNIEKKNQFNDSFPVVKNVTL